MKKIVVICLLAILTGTVSTAPVNEKVFATTFPEVQETTWYNNDTHYSVYSKNTDDSKMQD